MKDEQRIKALEDEIKVLKNEVKSVLLDVREQYLNIQNPFNMNTVPSAGGLAVGANLDSPAQPSIAEESVEQSDDSSELEEVNNQPEAVKEDKAPNKAELAEMYKASESGDMPVSMPAGTEKHPGSSQDEFSSFGPRHNGDRDEYEDQRATNFSSFRSDKKRKSNGGVKSEVDMVVIAGLTQWIDQATAKLGRERTEILIEMSFTMGHLPENLKDALVKMTRISSNDSAEKTATASDYLAILAQLENLLAGSQLKDNALLSILSMIKDTKNG